MKFMRRHSVLLVLLGWGLIFSLAGGYFSCQADHDRYINDSLSDSAFLSALRDADPIASPRPQTRPDKPTSRPRGREKINAPAPAEAYYMIKASTYSPDTAQHLQQQWHARYSQVHILSAPDGLYRIAVAEFNNWRKATRFLQQQYEKGDTTLWIWHPTLEQ